ncbi:DNA replication checkpoint protein tel2 [Hypsizygus marmoreus]|uniref:DNA replication checkpoint protein tel2 n=1 Tax=Hypsizygus marmoreus TaxID=39966 RepID=A0A369JXU8_HYPMA|nr:DNA replication checkpoint protein tel2 [Hypsizygus marmoreus]
MESAQEQVRDVIDRLQRPIPDLSTLLSLLSSPLDCLGLLPPQYRRYNRAPLPDGSVNVQKHLPLLQRALLEHIAPTWDTSLAEEKAKLLLEQHFCPDSFSFASPVTGDVVLIAYSTITSQPPTSYAIHILTRLTKEYPVDRLHSAVFTRKSQDRPSTAMLSWEDCVRCVVMIPAKVANAIAGHTEIPLALEHGTYFNNVCARSECLIASLSTKPTKDAIPSVSYLLAKLVNMGLFPATPPVSRSQPSFFMTTLSAIRARLASDDVMSYSNFWSSIFLGLPSSLVLQSILTSLLASLTPLKRPTSDAPFERALVKRDALVLNGITGYLTPENAELWESACAIVIGKDWDIGHARIFVCWMCSASRSGRVNEQALDTFLQTISETWSSSEHIKHSFLSRHQYITSLLLIAVSYLPPSSPSIQSLAFSPTFISGIGVYVAHLDPSVRRCGMLAAEVVAQRSGKKLDFGDWEGDDSGKPWAREIRKLLAARDVDADFLTLEADVGGAVHIEEIATPGVLQPPVPPRATTNEPTSGYDSDDSITGYASPPSSRSASPTPSELAEIEKDPTLNVGVKKISRPVYLVQLGELLRSTGGQKSSEDPHDADRVEMALNCAEELIRKKKGYGTELDENAVNLVYGLLSLQDNYDLDDFEAKRQSALNALIACCPKRAAPALIEEFFKNQYSTTQRYVALNALALGAREMASLPIPASKVPLERISFPSKKLPGSLHQKYLTAGEQNTIPLIMDSISDKAIKRGREATSDKVPEIVRERRLRVQKSPGIVEVSSPRTAKKAPTQKLTPFTEVATEFFIAPLINRFWLFLRDEQTREERTAHLEGRQRYHGAGTGLILNPLVLAQFLRTLAILVHASQNAPEWLAVVAPEALELAVTIGTRPVSHTETDDDQEDDQSGGQQGKEASVLTSALELTLIVLDGCLELDGGRVIGLEHTSLLLGAGEWAGGVFSQLEKGVKVQGGGGIHETKLRRAAAGVLLKVDDLTSRWRRSMLDTR